MAENLFRTSDTGLATFLISQSMPLVSIDYTQPRYEYAFNDTPALRDLSTKYLIGNALVDPATLLRINTKLMRIIHNQLQWEQD